MPRRASSRASRSCPSMPPSPTPSLSCRPPNNAQPGTVARPAAGHSGRAEPPMSDLAVAARQRASWLAEARIMVELGWPLVATHLAQVMLTTTNVLLMGRLGPDALAAGALGLNLYMSLSVFGVGVTMAAAPIMAREVGRRLSSVRDVRRTLRQSLWTAASIALVAWLVLWHAEAICLAMGQEPELAAAAGEYMRFAQWALLPHLGYVALRSFVTVLQRPRAAMSIVLMAVVLNVPVAWFLIFGAFGIP